MRTTKENMTAGYQSISERLPGPVGKVASYPARMREFLHVVRVELSHVTWPTWVDVRATTAVVLVAVFFFGFYLGLFLDRWLFGPALEWLLRFGRSVTR